MGAPAALPGAWTAADWESSSRYACAVRAARFGGRGNHRLEHQDDAQEASTVPEHRQEFQRELEVIEAKVIELFAVVAEDLFAATRALLDGDGQVAQVLAERDLVIDALYREIDQLVSREIALQAPVASDLRFLLSVLRVVPELERSHHLVVHIAYRAGHILSEGLTPRCQGLLERMGNLASAMWQEAADSWYQRERSAAVALGKRDEEMDELHASLIAELASGRMAAPVTMEMTLVARFYERLGDHAVNIARRVVYLAGTAKN
jgi:phosphate transport system protein